MGSSRGYTENDISGFRESSLPQEAEPARTASFASAPSQPASSLVRRFASILGPRGSLFSGKVARLKGISKGFGNVGGAYEETLRTFNTL